MLCVPAVVTKARATVPVTTTSASADSAVATIHLVRPLPMECNVVSLPRPRVFRTRWRAGDGSGHRDAGRHRGTTIGGPGTVSSRARQKRAAVSGTEAVVHRAEISISLA